MTDSIPSSEENTQPSISMDEQMAQPPETETTEAIPLQALQKDAQQRSQQNQPVITRILKSLQKEKQSFRELIINAEPLEKRVALLVDGVLEKFDIERTGENRIVGSIFKGKIQNLEPGLKAAFVDIGLPKNAFLHYWDILPAATDSSVEIVRENRTEEQIRNKDKITIKDIPNLYPVGTEIVIQVTKSQIGTKGPRTTTNLAIPGRYLVLMPYSGQCGISRKIEDNKERQRLKNILRRLTLPEGMGVIIRTAGEGKKLRYFIRDLHILLRKWDHIQEGMNTQKSPVCLYREPDIIERTVRDFLTEDIDRVLVDNEEDHQMMLDSISQISRRSKAKIARFTESIPIFERFNIERQIEQTFLRKVTLPSGGEIVIDETEALVAIDVNTGSHRNVNKDGKDTILQVNLEAAREMARQIRLRNTGGLIIMDFIDMKNPKDRKAVYNLMRAEMTKDKAKCHILPISQLGIMQMTRQRHQESVSSGIYTGCPYCHARGIVKSPRTMSVEIQRRLVSVIRRLRAKSNSPETTISLRILLHPSALERLRSEDENLLEEIETLYNTRLSFRADYNYHVENFKIIDILTGEEYR
jgi:ribonuclease G